MARQLALDIELPQSATLAGFAGRANADARAAVAEIVDARSQRLFLHGPTATGKTHLLQAAVRAVGEHGGRAVYLPLDRYARDAAALVAGFGAMDLIALDAVGAVAGQRETELALVGVVDELNARGARLLAADRRPPDALGLALADLVSRLGAGGVLATRHPDDADKRALLTARAAQRGIALPAATADWLLRHAARDVTGLIAALDRLAEASLTAKRRLTVPFARTVLRRQ